jgi:hypothetical protein
VYGLRTFNEPAKHHQAEGKRVSIRRHENRHPQTIKHRSPQEIADPDIDPKGQEPPNGTQPQCYEDEQGSDGSVSEAFAEVVHRNIFIVILYPFLVLNSSVAGS